MWKDIDRRIAGAMARVRQVYRGIITLASTDGPVMLVQLKGLPSEGQDGIELFQHFGLTSCPPAGTMAIAVPIGGKTSHSIVIATEHGSLRMKNLKSGETAIYSAEGAHVHIKQGRVVAVDCDRYEVNCKNYSVTASEGASFETPLLQASEQVTAQGKLTGNGGMAISGGDGASFAGDVSQTDGSFMTNGDGVASGTSLHGHHHNGDSGGVTSGPI